MPGGKHVSRGDCKRMRELYDRDYWAWVIAEEMDVGQDTVYYHVHGRCSHQIE